jgi:outer membrane protein OmpA-like peptidoglycan-associated protein
VPAADTFRFRTPLETFLVRFERFAGPPSPEQQALARRAISELRFGIAARAPSVLATAQQIVAAIDGRRTFALFAARALGASLRDASVGNQLLRRLEEEFERGRLIVEREQIASLSEHRDISVPELPPLPAARRGPTTRTFEVRFVDEIGTSIPGVDAEFTADGAQTRATNAAGIALLDGVQATSASVSILDVDALTKVLDRRWENFRPGKPPKESNTTERVFRGDAVGPFPLKAAVPNTVVIKPPLGKLFVEIWDKTGRTRHANRTYQISGPQSFEGTTDEGGRLLQVDVFPGNYQLSLALEFFEKEDPDRRIDIVDSPLVVLDPAESQPQLRMLGAVPRSVLARLRLFFNTNKAFLLPTALPSLKSLRQLYVDNAPCQLLVVGHADTRGGTAYNDQLSLERAEATIAYLKDDVEAWFNFYSDNHPKKRWGKVEDHLMLMSMPDFVTKPKGENEVRWFQRTRGLDIDGVAGTDTRHALIQEYLSLDGASLREFVGEIEAVAHGCGENFPLDERGEELDRAPTDEKRDPVDRRVELFFFDKEFGITPPPPAPNSKPKSSEYPLWRKRVAKTVELEASVLAAPRVRFVELADAHFRTDSAVVLPQGEEPDVENKHQSLSSAGLIAQALRFNEEQPGRSVFVAGHTDTSAGDALNDKLSSERAKCALALLEGDRDTFATVANARHQGKDINQILAWMSEAFKAPAFDCKPAAIKDFVSSVTVRKFQKAFNRNKAALGSTAADLTVDGSVGVVTWGAFFDCYEFALRQALGEDATGVAGLRGKLKFVDEGRKALGFGERFPTEELGVDNFRSQTNRRVEILFFEPDQEPDLAHSEDDPETSDVYLPGHYSLESMAPR